MSFLGGGDASCSTAGNPLSQFQKHVQDDKSLQRDRLVGRGPGGVSEGFRSRQAGAGGDGMMDEFMQQPHMQQPGPSPASPFAMEQLRREFESMHTGPAQRSGTPQHNWASEFDVSGDSNAHMEAAFKAPAAGPAGFDEAEFQRFVQMKTGSSVPPSMASNSAMNGFQRPMGMGYSSMYSGGMGMGYGGMGMMGNQNFGGMNNGQAQMQGKGKERMVELDDNDWEAQFAQLDTTDQTQEPGLDDQAQRDMEAELEDLDRRMADEEHTWREHAGDFSDWDNFDSPFNAQLRDPEMGTYMFEEENPFKALGNPFEEGVRIMDGGGNLSLAALAFEAAVQSDPSHVDAWTRLGASQAQNEKEAPAIRALEQAVKLDPTNTEAPMGLAVSYTNEGYDSTAYRTLERWLSVKYPSVAPASESSQEPWQAGEIGFTDRHQLHERVTNLFIQAAQMSPDATSMDPDVQVGLGVLFYGAEEFDKAVDCFGAALASNETGSTNAESSNQRPLLWNRLGATLANSGRSEEAIDAYEKALELNPSFVRARYNLGVSCINIGCYAEAAQHLLGALAMHKVAEREGREKAKEIVEGGRSGAVDDQELDRIIRQNQSTNLYDTLRRVFGQMDRRDLADKVGPGVDVDIFRGEFDF